MPSKILKDLIPSFIIITGFVSMVLTFESIMKYNKNDEPASFLPVDISKEELNELLPSWFLNTYQLCDDDYNTLRLNPKLQLKNNNEYNDLKNGDYSRLNKYKRIPDEITEYILLNCNNEQIISFMSKLQEKIIFDNVRVSNDIIIISLLIYLQKMFDIDSPPKNDCLIYSNSHDKIVDFILQQYGDNRTELVQFIFDSSCLFNTNNRIVDIIEDVLINDTVFYYNYRWYGVFNNKNPRMGEIFKKWIIQKQILQNWYSIHRNIYFVGINPSLVDYIEEELQNPNIFGLQLSMNNDSITNNSFDFKTLTSYDTINAIRYLFQGLMSNPNEKTLLLIEKYKVVMEKYALLSPYHNGQTYFIDIKSRLLKNPILIDNSYYQHNDFILK
jgi:hypothetical protein